MCLHMAQRYSLQLSARPAAIYVPPGKPGRYPDFPPKDCLTASQCQISDLSVPVTLNYCRFFCFLYNKAYYRWKITVSHLTILRLCSSKVDYFAVFNCLALSVIGHRLVICWKNDRYTFFCRKRAGDNLCHIISRWPFNQQYFGPVDPD